MARVTLKRGIGDGGACQDESHGESRLYDVLKELCANHSELLAARLGTIATGVLIRTVIEKPTVLRSLTTNVEVCGSAGATTVQARVNGVAVTGGALTTDNADADGTSKTVSLNVSLKAGDVVDVNVSAAPTGGTGLNASLRLRPCDVE